LTKNTCRLGREGILKMDWKNFFFKKNIEIEIKNKIRKNIAEALVNGDMERGIKVAEENGMRGMIPKKYIN